MKDLTRTGPTSEENRTSREKNRDKLFYTYVVKRSIEKRTTSF